MQIAFTFILLNNVLRKLLHTFEIRHLNMCVTSHFFLGLCEKKPEEESRPTNQDEGRDYENVSFSFSATLPKCLNEHNSSFV